MTLLNILQIIFYILIIFVLIRSIRGAAGGGAAGVGGAGGAGGKLNSFGKSKARMLSEAKNKITFADVAGVDEAREEVEEVVDFLKDPGKFKKLGGKIPRGVLLVGSPGTGKTLLAKAIAGEAGVPFFSISGSDFVEMFVGVGASRVRSLFEDAKKHAPCIIFIDEIDAVGRHRGGGAGGSSDEREQTLNQLLGEMDGFDESNGVIVIAATNRVDVLDPALLRPGRFDRRITVNKPDLKGRLSILRVHTKGKPLSPDVDLETIAKGMAGCSGAEIGNLVNEAAIIAARRERPSISMADFELAKDKVFMGPERKSLMSPEEKWSTSVHEIGHTLVSVLLDHYDPVHKVTIIPRGQALGLTWHLPKADSYTYSKEQAESKIAVLLGGRIAEEIVFGNLTTGASNDIERATDLAHRMVCEWGMSEKLGTRVYVQDTVLMSRGMPGGGRGYSEATAQVIDEEVMKIINTQYERVRRLLTVNRGLLEELSKVLLDKETLDAEEINAVIKGIPLPHREKVIIPSYNDKPRRKVNLEALGTHSNQSKHK